MWIPRAVGQGEMGVVQWVGVSYLQEESSGVLFYSNVNIFNTNELCIENG